MINKIHQYTLMPDPIKPPECFSRPPLPHITSANTTHRPLLP